MPNPAHQRKRQNDQKWKARTGKTGKSENNSSLNPEGAKQGPTQFYPLGLFPQHALSTYIGMYIAALFTAVVCVGFTLTKVRDGLNASPGPLTCETIMFTYLLTSFALFPALTPISALGQCIHVFHGCRALKRMTCNESEEPGLRRIFRHVSGPPV